MVEKTLVQLRGDRGWGSVRATKVLRRSSGARSSSDGGFSDRSTRAQWGPSFQAWSNCGARSVHIVWQSPTKQLNSIFTCCFQRGNTKAELATMHGVSLRIALFNPPWKHRGRRWDSKWERIPSSGRGPSYECTFNYSVWGEEIKHPSRRPAMLNYTRKKLPLGKETRVKSAKCGGGGG